ncbi:hypothetical protein SUDANB60_06272 (plasmid) [Streptomyces sp. enrichment culture]
MRCRTGGHAGRRRPVRHRSSFRRAGLLHVELARRDVKTGHQVMPEGLRAGSAPKQRLKPQERGSDRH